VRQRLVHKLFVAKDLQPETSMPFRLTSDPDVKPDEMTLPVGVKELSIKVNDWWALEYDGALFPGVITKSQKKQLRDFCNGNS